MENFEEAVRFHGHACPGLAFGFRAAEIGLAELGIVRSRDEELVAICENRSCAVDAIQVLASCTAGKGNLIFRDYGKQVYTFIKRQSGEAVRLAVCWEAPPETEERQWAWREFSAGNRGPEVMGLIRAGKAEKIRAIRAAAPEELFRISRFTGAVPEPARVYASVRCDACGEKVMEPMAHRLGVRLLCIPCREAEAAATP